MTFTVPVDFKEALRSAEVRRNLPTTLGSRSIALLDGDIKRLANFSATVTSVPYLDAIAEVRTAIVSGKMDMATARQKLEMLADDLNLTKGDASIKDLSAEPRTALIVDTNAHIAQSFGWFEQGQDQAILDAFPAQELFRAEARDQERDWAERWKFASRIAGDNDALRVLDETGRMIARKDSRIWDELGSPANFKDALGNPFPPFAFLSGMDTRDVGYSDSIDLGLIEPGEQIEPRDLGIEDVAKLSANDLDANLREAILKQSERDGLNLEFRNGELRMKEEGGEPEPEPAKPEPTPTPNIDEQIQSVAKEVDELGSTSESVRAKYEGQIGPIEKEMRSVYQGMSTLQSEHWNATDPEERASLLAKLEALRAVNEKNHVELVALRTQQAREMASIRESMLSAVEVENRATVHATIEIGKSAKTHAVATRGLAAFQRLVSAEAMPEGYEFPIESTRKDRSFYRSQFLPGQKGLFLSSHADVKTAVHELGHALESANPRIHEAARKFFEQRTVGENAEKLSKLTGNRGYKADEIAKKDKFPKEYCGKIYPGWYKATEVVSMGLEFLYDDAARFAREDPEYFRFILKIARGGV